MPKSLNRVGKKHYTLQIMLPNYFKFIILMFAVLTVLKINAQSAVDINYNTYILFKEKKSNHDAARQGGLDMVFGTDKQERMRLNKDGNLGIGTINPESRLHVIGNTGNNARSLIVDGENGDGGDAPFMVRTGSNLNTSLADSDTQFIVTGDGKVGIGTGTGSPSQKLHVNGNIKTNGGIIFVRNEASNFTASEGLLFYDRNFYQTGETGDGYFDSDGGGLSIYNQEDGWSALIDTKNMPHLNAQFMSVSVKDNVGIGTTSPTAQLHVKDGLLRVERNNIQVDIFDNSTQTAGWIGTHSNHPLEIATNNSAKMHISTAGNVGIGTTSPTEKLHVNGNIKTPRGIFLGNNELSNFTVSEGLLFYDRNFSGNGETGGGYFDSDGGGLSIYNQQYGWSALIDTKNMPYLKAQFKSVGVGTAPVSDIAMKVKGSFDVKNSSDKTVFHVSSGKELVFVGDSAYIQYQSTLSDPNSVIQENDFSLWVSKGVVTEDIAIVDVDEWSDFVFAEDYDLHTLEEVATYIAAHGHLPEMPSEAEVKAQGYSVHDINKKLLQKIEELTLYTIQQEDKLKAQEALLKAQQEQFNSLEQRIKLLEEDK